MPANGRWDLIRRLKVNETWTVCPMRDTKIVVLQTDGFSDSFSTKNWVLNYSHDYVNSQQENNQSKILNDQCVKTEGKDEGHTQRCLYNDETNRSVGSIRMQ